MSDEYRVALCRQCDEHISMTNKDGIVLFCSENCLTNWGIDNWEKFVPKKEETLEAIGFEENREVEALGGDSIE